MGQKVSPNGIRLGYTKNWNSTWYAGSSSYAVKLNEDINVRKFLHQKLASASVSKIEIKRPSKNVKIIIYTARPGIVIGKRGEGVEKLCAGAHKLMKDASVQIDVKEIRKPELDAKLVSESVAKQLEKRVMFRKAMKRAIQASMKFGAKGIKVMVSGRLGGAEIARSEWSRDGRVPLQTFRADVDYATSEALTTYGIIGVKVWIYKGEILPNQLIEMRSDKKGIK